MKKILAKKKTIFTLSFIVVILFITLMVVLFPANKIDAPVGGTNGVPSFVLLTNWSGTNGQVVKAITADVSNIYAACGYDGLLIFRISDMSNLGSFSTNQPVNDAVLKVISTNKYVLIPLGSYNGMGGVMTLNVNDPSNLTVAHFYEEANKNPVAVDYMFTRNGLKMVTADDFRGFQSYLIDWNNATVTPENPVPLGARAASDIAVAGNKVFIAAKEEGVFVIDTATGKIVAHMKPSLSLANSVFISGKTLLVADKMNGIMLYDIGNPSQPKLLADYDTPGDADDAWLVGDMIYIADGINGVLKVKWTPPEKFTLQKIYTDGSIAYQLFVAQDKKVYVACGSAGLKVLMETNDPAPPIPPSTNQALTNASLATNVMSSLTNRLTNSSTNK